jgi:hypothetical protein
MMILGCEKMGAITLKSFVHMFLTKWKKAVFSASKYTSTVTT